MEKYEISKAVIKEDGRYLLLKRASHSKSFPNLWDFVGGKHDAGETAKESVVRETKEETSFDIHPQEEIAKLRYRDGRYDLLFHYFEPLIVSGELKISSDHSESIWLEESEITDLELHPSVSLFLEFIDSIKE